MAMQTYLSLLRKMYSEEPHPHERNFSRFLHYVCYLDEVFCHHVLYCSTLTTYSSFSIFLGCGTHKRNCVTRWPPYWPAGRSIRLEMFHHHLHGYMIFSHPRVVLFPINYSAAVTEDSLGISGNFVLIVNTVYSNEMFWLYLGKSRILDFFFLEITTFRQETIRLCFAKNTSCDWAVTRLH